MVLILKTMFPMLLWAWILSSTYNSYVIPRIQSFYDIADDMAGEGRGGSFPASLPEVASLALRIVLTAVQLYILGIWSAYCTLRVVRVTHIPGTEYKWLLYVAAFFVCEGALGTVAYRENYRGILSVLHYAMAMGMFVMFCLNPGMMVPVYPWLIRIMKVGWLL